MRQQQQAEKVTRHKAEEAIQSREEYLPQHSFLTMQNTALEMTQLLCQVSMSSGPLCSQALCGHQDRFGSAPFLISAAYKFSTLYPMALPEAG